MPCEDLVVGCFLDDRAPLAVPELNRERTLKYLECCYKQGMSWRMRSSRFRIAYNKEESRAKAF
jgi:hypothetical protein